MLNKNFDKLKGAVEFVSNRSPVLMNYGTRPNRCILWRNGSGYLLKSGGYSNHPKANKLMLFNGPGEAIRYAAVLGFAITRWS